LTISLLSAFLESMAKQKSISISDEINSKIEELAKKNFRNFSNQVELLLRKALEDMDEE